jgi:hypothetical protein
MPAMHPKLLDLLGRTTVILDCLMPVMVLAVCGLQEQAMLAGVRAACGFSNTFNITYTLCRCCWLCVCVCGL